MKEKSAKVKNSREGLKWSKVMRFIALPFCPSRLEVYFAVRRFEDIPVEKLIEDGVQGVLLDADGTLGPHHTRVFPESSVETVRKMAASGLKAAIYTNSSEDRFHQFKGIPVVGEARPKPESRGFEQAMKNCLHLNDPRKVCMIGDNFITDGGAIDAGMRFIHVLPVIGNENLFLRITRYLAYRCALFHFGGAFDYGQSADVP